MSKSTPRKQQDSSLNYLKKAKKIQLFNEKPTIHDIENNDNYNKTINTPIKINQENRQTLKFNNTPAPIEHVVFKQQHGIAYGKLIINKEITSHLNLNIFTEDSYECALRFSSDSKTNSANSHAIQGLSLKLFGKNISSDFFFQNVNKSLPLTKEHVKKSYPLEIIDKDFGEYIKKHPNLANTIISIMRGKKASCLSTSYWSVLPFNFNTSDIVKYRLVPENTNQTVSLKKPDNLKLDLEKRLLKGGAKFRFEIQLDKKSIETDFNNSEQSYICIAELHISQQDISTIEQPFFKTNLTFNIWRNLEGELPLNSLFTETNKDMKFSNTALNKSKLVTS
ncbi:hypothetical protein OAT18_01720 [Tenacibaculum sp.]|nr:hypothetical protein [Tenacibaculum sp.]